MALLEIQDMSKAFRVRRQGRVQFVHAVRNISLAIDAGETLGIVGESGSGKSTTARLALNLIRPDTGTVSIDGQDILSARGSRLRALRRRMPMVFQDPYSSLDPMWVVGDIIGEALRLDGMPRAARTQRVRQLLDAVNLPTSFADRYTYELSGGQRQRVAIARALACDPSVLVCDEALSALDVSTQARMLGLFRDLQEASGFANLFVAHDLTMVRAISTRVAIMYLGRIVEYGSTSAIYGAPAHPYSQALIDAVPVPDPERQRARERVVLTGEVPSPIDLPVGCSFRQRCPRAIEVCSEVEPELSEVGDGRSAACHNPLVVLPVPSYRGSVSQVR